MVPLVRSRVRSRDDYKLATGGLVVGATSALALAGLLWFGLPPSVGRSVAVVLAVLVAFGQAVLARAAWRQVSMAPEPAPAAPAEQAAARATGLLLTGAGLVVMLGASVVGFATDSTYIGVLGVLGALAYAALVGLFRRRNSDGIKDG